MKKIIITLAAFFILNIMQAQMQEPVKWNYTTIKKSDKVYTVNISATLATDWHIYSMSTPGGGPVPTTFTFKRNPLITINGKTSELGNLSTVHDEVFGVDVKYFSHNVTFAQVITLKSPVKTNFSGTIKYMACNDKMCLPPKTVPFNVQLN